jgi:hypothetical protein
LSSSEFTAAVLKELPEEGLLGKQALWVGFLAAIDHATHASDLLAKKFMKAEYHTVRKLPVTHPI